MKLDILRLVDVKIWRNASFKRQKIFTQIFLGISLAYRHSHYGDRSHSQPLGMGK